MGQRCVGVIALCQVDLWIEFVEAHNQCRSACDDANFGPIALDCRLEVMGSAY
jgi:hypothetical protein